MEKSSIEIEPQLTSAGTAQHESQWWSALAVLYRWRWFIVLVTFLTAGVASYIAFQVLLPYYMSTSKVMMPLNSSGNGLAQALAGRGASAAVNALLGGASGDYTRYMSILNSRSLRETVVRKFDLLTHYNLKSGNVRQDWEDTLDMLDGNLDIRIDEKEENLSINVYDTDAKLAAEMANYMTAELNRRNAELISSNAKNNRSYVERRYLASKNALDSLQNVRQQFQEKYGVIELDKQLEAYYQELTKYRMQVAENEIAAELVKEEYGAENNLTQIPRSAAEKSREQYNQFIEGKDRLMPVSLDDLPVASREYGEIYQNILIQAKLLESLTPLYEQSLFDEKRQTIAVQVLDTATPAFKKSGPKRMIIIAVSAISALMLAGIFALLYDWLRRRQGYFSERLSTEVNWQRQSLKG